MSSSVPAPATVLEVFDALDAPGTPLTTPEVAAEFDCVDRTIYNKLEILVGDGALETKKVGARGRVWWRPPTEHGDGTSYRELLTSVDEGFCVLETVDSSPNQPTEFRYVAANPAVAEYTGVDDVVGKTIRDTFPGAAEAVSDHFESVLQTGDTRKCECELEAQDRALEMAAVRLEDGAQPRLGALFTDSTARTQRDATNGETPPAFQAETDRGQVGDESHAALREPAEDDTRAQRTPATDEDLSFLSGGGEMGDLIREKDWSETPLGPIETWSRSLRTAVSVGVASNFPINIIWGDEHTQIYNDGYRPLTGDLHPESMGQDYTETWASAWDALEDPFESALGGETAFLENQRMFLEREGYTEETFFTFSLSPIFDETGDVGGLFHPVTEMTQQTLAQRRLGVLRDIADRTSDANTVEAASTQIMQAIADHERDLPFALLYQVEADGTEAELVEHTGLEPGTNASPEQVDLTVENRSDGWPFADVVRSGDERVVDDLDDRFGSLSCGPYEEPPAEASVLPIHVPGMDHPLGFLVAGVSSRRALDDPYRDFYARLRGAVTNALVTARTYEQERERAEELAELDRAKTTFFNNVSHEFRTPLTLMLGPLEDALEEADDTLPPAQRERLETAHSNSKRLLKLVNSLLDFSRIEAGRMEASYEPTDLADVTADLASNFRSAIERAGLDLDVDTPSLSEPVYVDREMWEKVVLNLLSNAFKYTFEGEITVSIRAADGTAELEVRDTGTGILDDELPNLFERFHQVESTRSRTHEGSGIGLALVQDLVELHDGDIDVESTVDEGSTFTVTIPLGTAHLPDERIEAERSLDSTAVGAAPYVEEALRWLPDDDTPADQADDAVPVATQPDTAPRQAGLPAPDARVLVADDNADMRDYLEGLLGTQWDVETVPDGEAALEAARDWNPDLVLADVMMPGLDGFELLEALRDEQRTREIPTILLSARAGEEARVEGLEAGADDYMVKPFSARELVARVGATLELSQVRTEAEEQLRSLRDRLFETSPAGILLVDETGEITLANDRAADILGRSVEELTGRSPTAPEFEFVDQTEKPLPDAEVPSEQVRTTGDPVLSAEVGATRPDGQRIWLSMNAAPLSDDQADEAAETVVVFDDVTERKRREERQEFLFRFSDALRAQPDEQSIKDRAVELLADHLDLDRCWISEVFEQDGISTVGSEQIRSDLQPMSGTFQLSEYPETMRQLATQPMDIQDVATDSRFSDAEKDQLAGFDLRALQVVPLRKGQRDVIWALAASMAEPRQWTNGEQELLEEAAERTWEAVERARKEAKIRKNEERQKFLLELSDRVRDIDNPDETGHVCTKLLAEEMDLDRCYFVEFQPENEQALVGPEYHGSGLDPVSGPYPYSTFPEAIKQIEDEIPVYDNVAGDETLPEAEKEALLELDFGAWIGVPVRTDEKDVDRALYAVTTDSHEWTSHEISLVEETADRAWTAMERTQAEEALQKSEEKYRTLFETIDEGFCVIDMMYDDAGEAVDYRFVEVNEAFERLTGFKDPVGETDREIGADTEQHWVEEYAEVARTGEPVRRENYHESTGNWYQAYISRVDGEDSDRVAIVFNDITGRKRREANLAFIAELAEDVTGMTAPDEIMQTVGTRLEEFMDLSTCILADVDEAKNEATIHHGWNTEDVPSLEQTFQLEEYFGDEFRRAGRAGETVTVHDTEADERADTEAYAQLGIGAFVTVPFQRNGRWVANITVTSEEPREWREDEIELVEDIADRIFPRIERARTEEELHESEERFRALVTTTSDVVYNMSADWSEMYELEGGGFLVDTDEPSETWVDTYIPDDARPRVQEAIDDAIREKRPFELEHRVVREDGTTGWTVSRASPLLNEDGEIREWFGAAQDVTARKEREQRIERQRDQIETLQTRLLETSPTGILVVDAEGEITLANDRAKELLGVAEEEIIGRSHDILEFDIVDSNGEQMPDAETPFERVRQTGQPVYNVEIVTTGADDDRVWISKNIAPVFDDSDGITEMVVTLDDVTERKQAEVELETELSATRALQEISTELIGEDDVEALSDRVLDAAIEIMDADFASFQLYDSDRNDLELVAHRGFSEEAEAAWQRVTPEDASTCARALQTDERVIASDVETSEFMAGTEDLATFRQEGIRAVQTTPLVSRSGDVLGMFSTHWETTRDLSEAALGRLDVLARQAADLVEHRQTTAALREREKQLQQATVALEHLNDASRELMDADEQKILDEAAPLMQTVLDVEYAGLWRYDSDTGELHQADERADPPDSDEIRYPDGFEERAWQTFVSGELDVSTDVPPHPDIAPAETPIRSGVIVPLGRHGVLCAGSTQPNEVDDTTIDLAETVAANVETGLDRADREEMLETRTDELTRLDGLNRVIRQIDQALVQADTHAEINRVVCERLADSELYEFAWIGEHDAAADTVDPQEWAGVDSGYVDDLTITTDDTQTGQGPVGTAVRTLETQIVEEIATDARFAPWREQTLAQGVRSCIAIPLVYENALYGVLNVYAGTLDTDEKDQAVLNELGETIAHTINAIETKETLHTDRVVELTLGLQPSDSILGRLAQHAGCRIEFEGLVPQADDSSLVFFTAHDANSDEIRAAGSESVAVDALTRITDRDDGSLFKARVSGPTLPSLLTEQDAVVRTLTFESDGVTAVVDLPSTATVREFVEAVQTTHPDTDLLSRRTHERSIQTPHEFKTTVEDEITARQQEILRTAYLSGFFQSPREHTGNEIADLLDVSQPTFTEHLRAGQHNLFELLFEEA